MQTENDLRKHPRVNCEIDSSFTDLEGPTPGSPAETIISDISEGGIRFRAGKFIPVHNKLLFRLRLPNQKLIEAVAQPAWIREIPSLSQYDIGAQFISLSEGDRDIIREFVQNF